MAVRSALASQSLQLKVQHANSAHQGALSEINAVAKNAEPVLAAESAVLFLEKLAPAIEQVESSSGGIGSAMNRSIKTLASNHREGLRARLGQQILK